MYVYIYIISFPPPLPRCIPASTLTGGDVKVSFENFRLMWVFTANDLRGDRVCAA